MGQLNGPEAEWIACCTAGGWRPRPAVPAAGAPACLLACMLAGACQCMLERYPQSQPIRVSWVYRFAPAGEGRAQHGDGTVRGAGRAEQGEPLLMWAWRLPV